MAQDKKTDASEDRFEIVEETLSRTEQYIEDNQKSLTVIIAVIVAIVAGFMAYNKFILEPNEYKAHQEMFPAQQYFAKDSFDLALNGDGNYSGFLYIIDNFGSTKAGNLSNYYAGISYLRMGNFESAISFLQNFDSDDAILGPLALGGIGDANMELGKTKDAIDYYLQASNKADNDLTTPHYLMKAGIAYEIDGDYASALKMYTTIKEKYENSEQGQNVEKYIARASIKK